MRTARHPTALRVQDRLHERGRNVEVRLLPDATRTAQQAAAAIGAEVGQIVKSPVFIRDGAPVIVLCASDRRVPAECLGLGPPARTRPGPRPGSRLAAPRRSEPQLLLHVFASPSPSAADSAAE